MRRTGGFCLAGRRVTTVGLVRCGVALLVLAVRGAARNVILQAADVPADYVLEKDDEMSPDDLANGLGITPPVLKQRLAFGYIRSFTKGGDPFVCCVIDSILITTADEAAATTTANDFRMRAV